MAAAAAFSLIELLITIALLVVIFAVGLLAYQDFQRSLLLTTTADEVATVLRQAQQNAMGATNDRAWGVQFLNNSYRLFAGENPASSNDITTYTLPPVLTFTNIQLERGNDYVIFSKLAGSTSDYGSVRLVLAGADKRARVLSINQVGLISEGLLTLPPCPVDLNPDQLAATRSTRPRGSDWHGAGGAPDVLIMRLYNTGGERADIDSLRFLSVPPSTPPLTAFQGRTVYNGWQQALIWEKQEGVVLPNTAALDFTTTPFYNRALGGGKPMVVDGLRFKDALPNGNYQLLLTFAQTNHCVINFTLPGSDE